MVKGRRKSSGKLSALRKVGEKSEAVESKPLKRSSDSQEKKRTSKALTAFIKVFGTDEERDRVYPLDRKEEFVVGRKSDADIPLADRKVSREHCKIIHRGNRYILLDLNSRNGTFLGGKKIKKHLLKDGDQIQVGMSRLLFFKAEKTEVLVQRSKRFVCELCGKPVDQSDLLSGKAEEVDGVYFCPECVASVEGEEVVGGATPAGLTPPDDKVTLKMTSEEVAAVKRLSSEPETAKATEEKPSPPSRPRRKPIPTSKKVPEKPSSLKKVASKKVASPSSVSPPSASPPSERGAVRERLLQAAKVGERPVQKTELETPEFSYEDVSSLGRSDGERLSRGRADETIYDEEVSKFASLLEPPSKPEDLSMFEEADIDELIDDLMKEE